MVRLLVTYTGNVQGVGFRWKVLNISKAYKITGYVKNLSTGDVEILVEGKREIVVKMIEEIDQQLKGFWRQMEKSSNVEMHIMKNLKLNIIEVGIV